MLLSYINGMLNDVVWKTLSGNTNGIHEYFWRMAEDLYHHLVDVARAKLHFNRQLLIVDDMHEMLRHDTPSYGVQKMM